MLNERTHWVKQTGLKSPLNFPFENANAPQQERILPRPRITPAVLGMEQPTLMTSVRGVDLRMYSIQLTSNKNTDYKSRLAN